MSDHLSPKAVRLQAATQIAEAEGRVRLYMRDAETQAREKRTAVALVAALRTELQLMRDTVAARPNAELLEHSIRMESDRRRLAAAVHAHRQRYVQQARDWKHPHDEALYAILDSITGDTDAR